MASLLGIDSIAMRPAFVAAVFAAATVVLIVKGAMTSRRPAPDEALSRPSRRGTALATLEAVYLRGDITHEDYMELSRRLRAR